MSSSLCLLLYDGRDEISVVTCCETFVSEEHSRQAGLVGITCKQDNIIQDHCFQWPGQVATTCHTYRHSYFDDNYYTAFRKVSSRPLRPCQSSSSGSSDRLSATQEGGDGKVRVGDEGESSTDTQGTESYAVSDSSYNPCASSLTKKKFKYSSFSDQDSTVTIVRKKKPKIIAA
jgi:hypothetical protein